MRIAFICTEKLPSPAIKGGAVQIMLDGIIPFLTDHQVTIFSISDKSLPNNEKYAHLEYFRFPRETYMNNVAEEIKKHQFDVIHVFNRPSHIPIYKESSPNSSFVLSLHNDMFSQLKLTKEEGLRAIECVDAITTVSNYIKQTIVKRYPQASNKVHVIYSGVDLQKYQSVYEKQGKIIRKEVRKHYNLLGKQVILFIGRLSKTKGPHLLINALDHLINKYPDIMLVIVGGKWFSDNTVDDYVQSLFDLSSKFPSHVLFTKYVPAENIPEHLVMADVFVCSSQWHEPLARVHYEAMAAGIPIITTNRGGNGEVIHHGRNGLVINDYDNPKAFADAIDYILTNPSESKSLGLNGREYVRKHFQFHHVAERLEKIYLQITQKNH
ncbi:glycosyltransferase family 4 protein [Metabacillus halosaccharovorans]|uniref:glycosyltransferase family 4 protein n=1 Tax=Metabacillus halosaccharovorans TaxID=930124 RepID=UPI0034CD1D0A